MGLFQFNDRSIVSNFEDAALRGLTRRHAGRIMEAGLRSPNNSTDRLGIDHERLTYFYQANRFRLTEVQGKVVVDLLT